jgi:putative membrane protein
MDMILELLSTLPRFAAYLGTAFATTAVFIFVYTAVTPQSEWKLLREGNISAALSFGGSLLGFVLPLASAIAHSVSLLDCVVWGLVALVIQVASFFALRLFLPNLPRDIEEDHRGNATFSGIVFLAVGILNAACMTW